MNKSLGMLFLVLLAAMPLGAEPKKDGVSKPAAPVELTASQIMEKTFSGSLTGFSQGTATFRMVLDDGQGGKKDRKLQFKIRKGSDGLSQYVIKFVQPADIKGTSFLVHEKKDAVADQYIYVPAVKVVRRVAAGSATSSFFGSDFLYADLLPFSSQQKDQADLKRLADTKIDGEDAFLIEVTPKVEGSPYGRVEILVQKKNWVVVQVKFFDREKKPLKTLKMRKLSMVDGHLIPVELEMKNIQKNSMTELYINDINTKAKPAASEFTQGAMQQ